MNWSEPVNFYCERASAAFWAEPVNALTDAGFLVAALAAFVEWRRAGGRDVPVLALIAVMVLIGLGSFAQYWSDMSRSRASWRTSRRPAL
jgi:hypothetical protein